MNSLMNLALYETHINTLIRIQIEQYVIFIDINKYNNNNKPQNCIQFFKESFPSLLTHLHYHYYL